MLPGIWPRQRSTSSDPATAAACVRWIGGRKIDRTVRAVRHHSVRGTLPILTLVLLLAACSDPSAPSGTGGVMDPPDMYQIRNGWTRKLVRVRIAPDTAVVPAGQTVKFTASGIFSDGRSRMIHVSWAANGGTIDSTGLFTADSMPGTYQVVGVEPLAGLTDTATVIDSLPPTIPTTPTPPTPTDQPPPPVDQPPPPVDQPPPPVDQPPPTVSSVSVTPAKATLVVGGSVQLKAIAVDSNGAVMTGLPVSWSSTNPAVASVSSSGAVQALTAGTTTLVASVQGVDGQASVTVNEPAPSVSSVSITPSSATLAIGESVQLSAIAKDRSGSALPGLTVSWSSSAPGVASVSSSGVVKGLASGTSLVTATIEGVEGRTNITVRTPISPSPVGCDSYSHDRIVSVSTASQLSAALANAQPGDLIRLADGRYAGQFRITSPGRTDNRITVCGTRNAVLDGGNADAGAGVYLKTSYWNLVGLSITNSLEGVRMEHASYNILDDIAIYGTGQAGVHMLNFSTHNTLTNSKIYNTGLHIAEYGEGVYVGTYSGQWCTYTNCQADASDFNAILNNAFGPNVRADHVDIKDGTSNGIVRGNTFDGRGMVATAAQPVWVGVFGNNYTIEGNTGSQALTHGFKTWNRLPGWGNGNVFRDNVADLQASGYGFLIASSTNQNVVACNNTVRNAGSGLANVPCR